MPESKKKEKLSWPLVGNSHIIDFLSKSITNEKIANAYIFFGPQDLGKSTVANYFAKCLLCQSKAKLKRDEIVSPCGECVSCLAFSRIKKSNSGQSQEEEAGIIHGDFHLIEREKDKKNISIEQAREFIKGLNLSSFLGSYKVGIIKEADSLSLEAANALLKTLEEPKEKVVIILIAANLESIPATIVSRSQVLNFYPVKTDIIHNYLVDEHKVSRSLAKNLSKISLGRPALAVKFLKDKNFYKDYTDKAKIFLDFVRQDINERLAGIEKTIGAGFSGQEGSKKAFKILEIWQGVARDLLLLDLGQKDLIQHHTIIEEFARPGGKFNPGITTLIKIIKNLEIGKEYLGANVSPKLVLENIAINIS
ncbi:MAG: hypothetical protein PHZ04_02680 [Patescibacteria group bacterium]|nr:hypothetical protein [Patescibacteria group bacterium]MDD5554624.1 hypothetical protein [Patescibacteria group bacterium]